jgi:predicted transcriptional regulator
METTLEPRLAVRVRPATLDRLRELAEREETSIGALVRKAIRLLLEDEDCRPHVDGEPISP